jgi:hypothetical protein
VEGAGTGAGLPSIRTSKSRFALVQTPAVAILLKASPRGRSRGYKLIIDANQAKPNLQQLLDLIYKYEEW